MNNPVEVAITSRLDRCIACMEVVVIRFGLYPVAILVLLMLFVTEVSIDTIVLVVDTSLSA